jgi:AraC-like DNA-binding protein
VTSGMSLKQWREQIGRHIIHLDFEPYGDAPFRAEVDPVLAHDGVRVTNAAISAGTTSRDKALVKLGTPARDLLIAKQPLFVRHRGRDMLLRPGEATFMRNWELGLSASTAPTAYTAVVLPVSANEYLASDELAGDGIIRRANPALQLLRSHLRVLENKAHRRMPPELQTIASRGLYDLAALLLSSRETATTEQTVAEIRFATALEMLQKHYRNPALKAEDVALALGVSVRSLNRMFERSGASLSRRLLELRLDAVRVAIVANGGARIADTALSCGFSDISSFNRSFRSRFGRSPSDLRD